jgi:hypothetical protein
MRPSHLEELPGARSRANEPPEPDGSRTPRRPTVNAQLDSATVDFTASHHPDYDLDDAFVDVTDAALEAGLTCAVAVSREAWNLCVAANAGVERDPSARRTRLSDMLTTFAWATARTRPGHSVLFEVPCAATGRCRTCVPLRAVAVGDHRAPAVVLTLPEDVS